MAWPTLPCEMAPVSPAATPTMAPAWCQPSALVSLASTPSAADTFWVTPSVTLSRSACAVGTESRIWMTRSPLRSWPSLSVTVTVKSSCTLFLPLPWLWAWPFSV